MAKLREQLLELRTRDARGNLPQGRVFAAIAAGTVENKDLLMRGVRAGNPMTIGDAVLAMIGESLHGDIVSGVDADIRAGKVPVRDVERLMR